MQKRVIFALSLAIFSLTVYSFFQFSGFQGYEDETYNRVVENIELGEFKTSRSGYAQTTLETPLVYLGQKIDQITQTKTAEYSRLSALMYNPLITALSVGMFFLIASLFASRKKSFLLSLVYAFGTTAFPYATIGMDPTSVLFLLVSAFFLFSFSREKKKVFLILSGFLYVSLLFSKAYYFITVPAFIIYLYFVAKETTTRKPLGLTKTFLKYCLWFFSTLVVVIPLYLWGNNTTFGVLIGGQYNLSSELLGGENVFFGTYGLLLSFGKSIFIYSPVLLVALFFLSRFYKKFPKEAIFLILYSVCLILFVAHIHYWSDETWGSRYLLSLSAFMLLPLVVTKREEFVFKLNQLKLKQTLLVLLIVGSFLFQMLGVLTRYDVFPYTFYDIYKTTGYNVLASQEYQYTPQFAPYFVNYNYIVNRITGRNQPLRYRIIYTPPMEQASQGNGPPLIKEIIYDTSKYRANAINFWWMNMPDLGYRRLIVGYALILLALATVFCRKLFSSFNR